MNAIVKTNTLAFKMKVSLFQDILNHEVGRAYLWNLYYAGEAYEELHPSGYFVGNMPDESKVQKQLAKHLSDETRHATVFGSLLEAEGCSPGNWLPEEDVGWYLLNHIVPDIVVFAATGQKFSHQQIARYMAFLHVLELRSISDMAALIEACVRLGKSDWAEQFRKILQDELFHATYSYKAVFEYTDHVSAGLEILDKTRKEEHRHMSLLFKMLVKRLRAMKIQPNSLSGKLRWLLMLVVSQAGVAIPLLPLYQIMPNTIFPTEDVQRRKAAV